jgi:hypothetical protein
MAFVVLCRWCYSEVIAAASVAISWVISSWLLLCASTHHLFMAQVCSIAQTWPQVLDIPLIKNTLHGNSGKIFPSTYRSVFNEEFVFASNAVLGKHAWCYHKMTHMAADLPPVFWLVLHDFDDHNNRVRCWRCVSASSAYYSTVCDRSGYTNSIIPVLLNSFRVEGSNGRNANAPARRQRVSLLSRKANRKLCHVYIALGHTASWPDPIQARVG